jgi:replicative DNA helicase
VLVPPVDNWNDDDVKEPEVDSRPPPSDEHAEAAIVATMLVDAPSLVQAVALVRSEQISRRPLRTLFEAMLALHQAGEAVDGVTVLTWLRERGKLGELGPGGLPGLVEGVAAVGNVAAYARAIRDAWRMRELQRECQRWIAEAYGSRGHRGDVERGAAYAPAQALLERAARTIGQLASDSAFITAQDGHAVMAEAHAYLAEQAARATASGMGGVTTGFAALDHATGGLHAGDLVLLGALPSMGKTALLTAIATAAAARGTGVLFFTLEMSARDIALRAACSRAGVSMVDVRLGAYLPPARTAALVRAMNDIAALPITWDGLSSSNPAATIPHVQELIAKAERAASHARTRKAPPVGLVVVDYLQRLRPIPRAGRSSATREEVVAESAKGLKLLAVRLGVPVLCAAALNRTSAAEARKPAMRDLRESGAVEYEADGVWLLHRDDYKHERSASSVHHVLTREAEVIIAKMRNAGTGSVMLGFEREYTRFTDLDEAWPSSAHESAERWQ